MDNKTTTARLAVVRVAARSPRPRPRQAACTLAPSAAGSADGRTAADTLRDQATREELRALTYGMIPRGTLAKGAPGRWRHDDAAPNTSRRVPLADAVADAAWAARVRLDAGHDPLAVERDCVAPVERAAAAVRAEVRRETMRRGLHAGGVPLPAVAALDIAETREQAEADVAVRLYLSEPASSPLRAQYAAAAIRELSEHLAVTMALRDRIREDEFALRHGGQPA